MSDPLLTSLCGICHISTPKYTCPRCGTRTCSLACIKKHKAWSECSGERDATAYIAPSKLRTPAGVDHDYNFLHGIELSVERAEKVLVEERKIVQKEELRPMTIQEVKWKPGRDGRKRKVLVTRVLREPKGRSFERHLAARLKKLNINIMCAPLGMARQRENNTSLNRRTMRVNWQVEWMTLEDTTDAEPKKIRALSKVMDDVPLYRAYHALLEEQQKAKGKQSKKVSWPGLDGQLQDWKDSTWSSGSFALQDPFTQTWTNHNDTEPGMWPSEADQAQKRQFQYFLANHRSPSDKPVVTKLESEDCLREVLKNTRILEFPTIWVLNYDKSLPSNFTLGPKDIILEGSNKRKRPTKKGPMKANKRRNRAKNTVLEEGEVNSDDEDDQSDDNADVGLEAGDVIAEQSLGEDDDSDDTSSSGSDSD
ncbi:hit zinc finger [Fusarium longipes]|uniref:Box C/D snoRNA protein 1 n=1 Tax=Fusarium longipes TaxID=694270 RepID=A0A395RI33_9HYPO|nr:hit zinc finger [Fusarium longipes]